MVFSSLSFLFVFLPIFLVIYYFIQDKFKNGLLFIGSLIFYAIGEPTYLFLIFLSIFINYFLALWIEKLKKKKHLRNFVFVMTLLLDFSALFVFKYCDFFSMNLNRLFGFWQVDVTLPILKLALPLGISFYTFQIVSYVADVYKGKIKAEKSFIDLGTYISMFPQLIAGPIVVYSDIHKSMKRRTVTIENLDEGLKIFIVGLGFKVILANRIGILWNEINTIGFASISTPLAWLGALAYSLQLYFDFCGYSMMAIGLGEMLGFKMPMNFNHPYVARSVTGFWRRWHMTLGAWFKEYVYIPLGGNRKGKLKMFCNLFVVWALVGLWHGADWNFLIWGLFIFFLQLIEKAFLLKFLEANNFFAKLISHAYIIFYILISWVIFAISDLDQLGIYLCRMFPFAESYFWPNLVHNINTSDVMMYLQIYGPILLVGIIFSTTLPKNIVNKLKWKKAWFGLSFAASLVIFWFAVYYLALGANNPFLYFRF